MPGRLLHVLELGAIFERRGDEDGAHRVRRVSAVEPELGGVFAHHAVHRVGTRSSSLAPALPVVPQRPEQRSIDVGAVAGELEIGADALGGPRIDGEGVASATLRDRALEPVPRALVELVARDRHFAMLYALRATDRLFRAAGSHVLFEGNELQRCLRDVHAVASRTTRLGAIAGPAGATEV
jgi:hypothetical protein